MGLKTEEIFDVEGALDVCEQIGFYNFISRIEECVLRRALEAYGNKRKASKMLHMNRTTFVTKFKNLGIKEKGNG